MNSFTKIRGIVFAGVMMVALAGKAMAGEPTAGALQGNSGQVAALQAKADVARVRATALARQGGWAYKTGAVDRATWEVARLQAAADAVRASGDQRAVAPISAELEAAQAREQELRKAGGWAYKSGAVARAEADVRALSSTQPVMMGLNETTVPASNWGKPVERTLRVYR
ncbi:MAG TPA: hypothetical protein VLA79_16980 [Polyangia bacterium]|jgi:hypothetical protein|nr:hypothetical protein [Polyangia bacterium]